MPESRYPALDHTDWGLPASSARRGSGSISHATSGSHSSAFCHDLTAPGLWAMWTTMDSARRHGTSRASIVPMPLSNTDGDISLGTFTTGRCSKATSMRAGTLSASPSAHAAVCNVNAKLQPGWERANAFAGRRGSAVEYGPALSAGTNSQTPRWGVLSSQPSLLSLSAMV